MIPPRLITRNGPLWVFDKPSGMAVHPTSSPEIPHLLEWAREHAGAPRELAPIHRIDRDTSGIVLCSPERETLARVGGWFADGRVDKRYIALVYGRPHKGGTIDRALSDSRRGKRLEAVTRFRRIEELGPAGGYVLGAVHNIQPDVPVENVLAMYRYARSYRPSFAG